MPTLFINDLTNIDCSILDPERGLIGASWTVDIELTGELDEQSMVFDFSKVKKTIKSIIDREVDHKLLIPGLYSGLTEVETENRHIEFTDLSGSTIQHQSPSSAVCNIDSGRINRQAVISYLKAQILVELPNNITDLHIALKEESVPGNYFRYSHGLKKHDGNCQRIAHGHRSQIQIWHNEQRQDKLEKDIAKRWHDIYLGSQEDIVTQTETRTRFAYTTEQGDFMLELNNDRIHILPDDSTIECIAAHIVDLLAPDNQAIKVKAFEGIGKGALAQTI